MHNIKIKKEELDTSRNVIAKAESIWNMNFPKDYVEFLLQYNGAIVYPCWPNLGPENKSELWDVERFFSVGDIILQKLYPMNYALHEIEEKFFEEYNLDNENLLVFAKAERGVYLFNLEEDNGQVYIANFAGGDGISKTAATSFSQFINSLGIPEWSDEEVNPNFEFSNEYCTGTKVMAYDMFDTPERPELGLQRFKEVFEFTGVLRPREGYTTMAQLYVSDRLKLEYLLEKGCSTEGLLTSAGAAETIQYLVEELKLDINRTYKNRYPLQNYLSNTTGPQFRYEVIHKLLEMGLGLDWSIKAKLPNGEDDLPMIEKLRILHEKYVELEKEEEEFYKEYNRPSGRGPFINSKLIKEKLGIKEKKSWVDQLLNKITKGKSK